MSLWQPSASVANLQKRAETLRFIRDFFYARGVMEVETPLMSAAAVSDPFIDSIEVGYSAAPNVDGEDFYLQTSPEYAMKRLLAAGSGPIYQLGKAFRNGEQGKKHNPEFTMLEWYRPGFDDQALMDEIETLLSPLLGLSGIERVTYADLFQRYLGFHPDHLSAGQLAIEARKHIDVQWEDDDRDTWLNLLMSHVIEPKLITVPALFVMEYPESQAALARVRLDAQQKPVAARFELFVRGVELANGYHELTDAEEQKCRLEADQQKRKELGLPQRPLDYRLVDALAAGMPDCAGVALGVDRLIMLMLDVESIAEVISFDFPRA